MRPIVGAAARRTVFRETASAMRSALDRKLLVITGKGGVGKTTIAAAAGLLAARTGRRTIVVEVGQESRLPTLFGLAPAQPGVEQQLQEGLSSISIDPDRALLEWLQVLGGRVSGRVLASSGTFQYFAAAAPGAKELVTMVKIWRLTRGGERRGRSSGHDLVVLDAPATGHALGLLGSPHTFGAIARVGPIAGQTRQVQELLESPSRSAYLAVALATEMAVTEALELEPGLQAQLGRGLDAVIVHALLPQRFSTEELDRIAALQDGAERSDVVRAAASAALAVHKRARFQHNQLARLRRRNFDVLSVPFAWRAQLDLEAVGEIARRLERKL
jgi:energy-coupling factor transporter ATP-binding protein EcfA2